MTEGGMIVGAFKTANPSEEHGFVRTRDGQYIQIDVPGSFQTEVYGVNNSGDLVGRYRDHGGVDHGYLLRNGVVTTIDYVGPAATNPYHYNGFCQSATCHVFKTQDKN